MHKVCADSNSVIHDGERGLLESIDFCDSKVQYNILLLKLLLSTKIFLINCAIDPSAGHYRKGHIFLFSSPFFSVLGEEVFSA